MILETQVQALTDSTELLLQAVNTRKLDLDNAVVDAQVQANAAAASALDIQTNWQDKLHTAALNAETSTTQAGIATDKAAATLAIYGDTVAVQTAVQTATTQAGIATTQAGIATTQAGIATTQAGISTTQAGISTTKAIESAASAASTLAIYGDTIAVQTAVQTATTQAGIATTQAGISTTQAGIATTQAGIATTEAGISTTQAGIATTKANLLGSVAAVTATGTVNIGIADAGYQLINPNGAARDVVLASLTATEVGYTHSIKNTGTAGNYLTVKNAAGTQLGPLVANSYSLAVVWSGSAWEVL